MMPMATWPVREPAALSLTLSAATLSLCPRRSASSEINQKNKIRLGFLAILRQLATAVEELGTTPVPEQPAGQIP